MVAAGYGLSSSLVAVVYQHYGWQHGFGLLGVIIGSVNLLGAMCLPATTMTPSSSFPTSTNTNHNHNNNHNTTREDSTTTRLLLRSEDDNNDDDDDDDGATRITSTRFHSAQEEAVHDEVQSLQTSNNNNSSSSNSKRHAADDEEEEEEKEDDNADDLIAFSSTTRVDTRIVDTSLEEETAAAQTPTPTPITGSTTTPVSPPLPPWISWHRYDFWILFLAFALLTGAGLFVINNLSTIVQSTNRRTTSPGTNARITGQLVYVLSFGNVSGRILSGMLADHPVFVHQKIVLFRSACGLMTVGLGLCVVVPASIPVVTLLVLVSAVAYGAAWVLIVGIITERYGRQHFGKDYGTIVMGPAVMGMVLNSISAAVYDAHASTETGICVGVLCYRDSYLLTACGSCVAFLVLWTI